MKRWFLLFLLCLWLYPADAPAQSCTAAMSNIDLGGFSALSSEPINATGSMTLNCSGFATPYVRVCVSLGLPTNGGTSLTNRLLPGPAGSTLRWGLYTDAARTIPWGSVWSSGSKVGYADIALSSGKGSAALPYYAQIPGGQSVVPGSYSLNFAPVDTEVRYGAYSSSPPTCSTSVAGSTSFSFTTLATATADCTIAATSIDFGQIGQITTPINTTGVVTATCSSGTAYSISLNAGQGIGATVSSRKLTGSSGNNTLSYALYIDAARTRPWGDNSSGTGTLSGTGTGAAQPATVYATLPAPAAVPPSTYVDTVIATITY